MKALSRNENGKWRGRAQRPGIATWEGNPRGGRIPGGGRARGTAGPDVAVTTAHDTTTGGARADVKQEPDRRWGGGRGKR